MFFHQLGILSKKKERRISGKLISNIEKWYWCNIFNERFDGSTITPISDEFADLLNWFDNGIVPKTVKRFKPENIYFDDIYQVNARYKGIMCLLIKNGILDFFDGKPIKDYPNHVDDHHIFPQDYLEATLNITNNKKINNIVNRTLIHKSTNRSKYVGNISPKDYLTDVKMNLGENKFDKLCESHLLEKDLNSSIYTSYNKFLRYRKKKIIALLTEAITK